MKKKHGIIAVAVVLLFVGLAFNPATAKNTIRNEENKGILLEYLSISEDGKTLREKLMLSEDELKDLSDMFSQIFEKINEKLSINKFQVFLKSFELLVKYPKLRELVVNFVKLRYSLRTRALVMSHGMCYKLNPLRKSEFKVKQKMSTWRYNSGGPFSSKTYILRPFKSDFEVLNGIQMGVMYKFSGIYMYVARKVPELSYTLFMGTARLANGFDLNINLPDIPDIPNIPDPQI